jgi:hypothetical protein
MIEGGEEGFCLKFVSFTFVWFRLISTLARVVGFCICSYETIAG